MGGKRGFLSSSRVNPFPFSLLISEEEKPVLLIGISSKIKPFFNLILQAGNARLAAVFIPKCANLEPGAAVTMYEKCGMRVKAAEEAVKAKDAEAWMRLLEAAGKNTPEGREIERLGTQVFKK